MTTAITETKVETPVVETKVETPVVEAKVEAKVETPVVEAKVEEKTGAPEAYTDFTMPEGKTIHADTLGEVKTLAKDLNLTQEQAQKIVDLGLKQSDGFSTELKRMNDEAVAGWIESAKADKDFGGDKFDANVALARQTFETYGTPELKTFLEASGLGNHPELLKWASKVASATQNDKVVPGGKTTPKGGINSLYDNPTSQHA